MKRVFGESLRNWLGTAAVASICLASGMAQQARADDAPPRSVMTISAASLKAVADEADRLGIPLPPFMTAAGIEQTFPFIGDKGMNPDVPIGLDWNMKAGWATAGVNGMLFVFPVKPNIATVDSLKAGGGKAIDDHADSVQLNADVLRRTDSDLIFGESTAQDAVFRADPADITDIYKAAPADGSADLLHIIANTRNLRDTDPSGFYKFLESSTGSDNAQTDKAMAGGVESMIKKIDMVDLGLSRKDQVLRISLSAKPLQIPAAGNFNAAGMPDDVVATVNIAASVRDLYPQLDDLLKQVAPSMKDSAGNGADSQKNFAALQQMVNLLAGGKALSLGVSMRAKDSIFYIVEQSPTGSEADRLKQAADAMNDADHTANAQISQYTGDSGASVSRLTGDETAGGKKMYIDCIEKNGTDYLTASELPGHFVEGLATLPPGKPMTDVVSGTVWPDRIITAAEAVTPGANFKDLETKVKGMSVNFSANAKDGGLFFHMDVPEELVKDIVAGLQHGGGGGGGGAGGGAGAGPGGGL